MNYPVLRTSNVLQSDKWNDFLAESQQNQIYYQQKYPRRLFSDRKHQDWLLDTFDDYINKTLKEFVNFTHIQQIFIGLELPGSHFLPHRSHPDIAGVAMIAMDDIPEYLSQVQLQLLVNSHNDSSDYLPHKLDYETVEFSSGMNTALCVANTEPRYHWGFSFPLAKCMTLSHVWIYLGK